jgi:hypothetical protein
VCLFHGETKDVLLLHVLPACVPADEAAVQVQEQAADKGQQCSACQELTAAGSCAAAAAAAPSSGNLATWHLFVAKHA